MFWQLHDLGLCLLGVLQFWSLEFEDQVLGSFLFCRIHCKCWCRPCHVRLQAVAVFAASRFSFCRRLAFCVFLQFVFRCWRRPKNIMELLRTPVASQIVRFCSVCGVAFSVFQVFALTCIFVERACYIRGKENGGTAEENFTHSTTKGSADRNPQN